jgi:hypothetical protein
MISACEKQGRLSSMSAAVKIVIDGYPLNHEFFGNELKDDVVRVYPEAVNMYVDTVLKMARRHRRDSYISIDRNNSLYKRVESNVEKAIRTAKEKQELKEREKHEKAEQLDLFSYAFFAFLVLGTALFVFGRPIFTFAKIDKTDLSYTASLVIGFTPAVSIRLRTASTDIFNSFAISETVIPSMPPISAYILSKIRKSIQYFRYFTIRLYSKKTNFFQKYPKYSIFNIDKVSTILDTLYRLRI